MSKTIEQVPQATTDKTKEKFSTDMLAKPIKHHNNTNKTHVQDIWQRGYRIQRHGSKNRTDVLKQCNIEMPSQKEKQEKSRGIKPYHGQKIDPSDDKDASSHPHFPPAPFASLSPMSHPETERGRGPKRG